MAQDGDSLEQLRSGFQKAMNKQPAPPKPASPDVSYDTSGQGASVEDDTTAGQKKRESEYGSIMDKMKAADAARGEAHAKGGMIHKPKLGTGERFSQLKSKLAKKGIKNPAALAAKIGRAKYGAKKFSALSHHNKMAEGGMMDEKSFAGALKKRKK